MSRGKRRKSILAGPSPMSRRWNGRRSKLKRPVAVILHERSCSEKNAIFYRDPFGECHCFAVSVRMRCSLDETGQSSALAEKNAHGVNVRPENRPISGSAQTQFFCNRFTIKTLTTIRKSGPFPKRNSVCQRVLSVVRNYRYLSSHQFCL